MHPSKQKKIDDCRSSLIKHNIEFKEGPNGHFQIYRFGRKIIDIWATTEKFIVEGCEAQVGMHLAGAAIKRAYGLK